MKTSLNSIKEIDIFKTSISSIETNFNTKDLIKFCKSLNRHYMNKSNVGGFHSEYFNLKDKRIKNLINEIEKIANLISLKKYSINKKLHISSMWSIINKKGDYNVVHDHPFSILSGVLYLKAPKNCGEIQFHNDFLIGKFVRDQYINNYHVENSSNWFLPVKENTMYVFPSWLRHGVKPNLSNDERVIISFNLE